MLRVGVVCFLASYLLAFGVELTRLWRPTALGRIAALGVAAAGFLAQTLYLIVRSSQTNLPPLLSSMHDWLLVLAWLVVLVYLFVAITERELAIGFVMWPLTIGLIVAANFVSREAGPAASVHRNWAMLHVALLVFGIAGVALGFVASLLFLWQHWRLKHGHAAHRGLALPSLERLERCNRWAVLGSVPLLTFGMIIGIGLTVFRRHDADPALIWADPLVVVSGVCWLVMLVVFAGLLTWQRTPGRQMAWLTVWSGGFLLFTTVGSQVLAKTTQLSSIHGPARPAAPATDAPPPEAPR